MSDERTRQLERRARQGDPDARSAQGAAACRVGQHAWTCHDLAGTMAMADQIACVRCAAVRPKDEHETAVEAWIEHLQSQQKRVVARVDITPAAQNRECERLSEEAGRMLLALWDYRRAIAPCMVIAMPPREAT